jgi:putative oxidoreductase
MKIAYLVSRILLGLLFLVFGSNGFLHFIPMQNPSGLAGQFIGSLFVSHYLSLVFLVQLIGGILLLANRYVPLALTLLGPVIVNILSFHIFLQAPGIQNGLIAAVLWCVVFAAHRQAFSGLLQSRSATQTV